jgi:hypothetical protein
MAKYLSSIQIDYDACFQKVFAELEGFTLNTLSDCFLLELRSIKFLFAPRLMVHITDKKLLDNNVELFIDIPLIRKYLNAEQFILLSDLQKRACIVQLLSESIVYVGNYLNKDVSVVQSVIKNVESTLNKFEDFFGRRLENKRRGFEAQLYYKYRKFIEVGCWVQDNDLGQLWVPLFFFPAQLQAVTTMFGALKLLDSETLIIPRKNTDDYWLVNIKTKNVEFVFARANRMDPHGMYDLGVMYLKGYLVMQDRERACEWLNKASLAGYSRADKALSSINN